MSEQVGTANIGTILRIKIGEQSACVIGVMDLSRAMDQDIHASAVALQVRHQGVNVLVPRKVRAVHTREGRLLVAELCHLFESFPPATHQANLDTLVS